MTDMLHKLINDHYRIKLMFRGFSRWTGDHSLGLSIAYELEAHQLFEEEALVPVVRSRTDSRFAEDIEEDHEVLRELVEKLRDMDPDSNSLRPTIHRLKLVFAHHIDHTETDIFPAIAAYRGDLFNGGRKITTRHQEVLAGKDGPKQLARLTTSNTGWGRNGPGRGNLPNPGW